MLGTHSKPLTFQTFDHNTSNSLRCAPIENLVSPPSQKQEPEPSVHIPEKIDSLDELVSIIHDILGEDDGLGDNPAKVELSKVAMSRYKSNHADWEKYAKYDGGKYTRNLVDSGNKKFNLLLLVWGPQIESPIHDHPNSHCILKVLDGKLTEELYVPSDSPSQKDAPLTLVKTTDAKLNTVCYMHDKLGYHRMLNTTPSLSVSLHLYSPPFNACKIFSKETGASQVSKCDVFYNGQTQSDPTLDSSIKSITK
ncbi:hypothetical protein BB558_003419 [Smittium angustum]|uniref:Cysteine dioxygenase n=1 Tax=Smittium angustum TaxID=133377 RepID=A0A2U1J614_SMIAN|nr:hypothetical protein BB558_003419 [Smittium angustum]